MKLLKQLKDLYPEYFWAVFGSTAIKMYDAKKLEKLTELEPSDIDVVTNASICTQAFKNLLHMMTDVIEIKQEHLGKYRIKTIKKRIQVITTEGTYDFIFVRELQKASEWLHEQASSASQCMYEISLASSEQIELKTEKFENFYDTGIVRWYYYIKPPTPGHKKKVRVISNMINK